MKHCGLLLFLFLLSGLPVSSQAQSAPDVLILVVQRPGLGDQVNITYSGLVPHPQVQQDLNALRQATGWARKGLKISDERAPVQTVRYMTGATFTAPNVVQNDTYSLPVEPFVTAFHLYKNLALIFVVDSSFQFQGLRQYADNNVAISLDQHGAAYTYRVAILNSQFTHLSLPGTAKAAEFAGKKKAHLSPLLLLLGIVMAAAAAGILAFVITNRLTAATLVTEKKPREEEETTAGTRR